MHKLSWQPVISITATTREHPDIHTHALRKKKKKQYLQQNTKSLFHSLPATLNFKQVLLMLNMQSPLCGLLERK